jgi:hypothetical protein
VSTSTNSPRSSVPEPRSGDGLVLQPLEPDEVVVEDTPQITRAQATAAVALIVCLAMFSAYRYWNTASLLKLIIAQPEDRSAPNGSGDKDPQPPDELPPYETPDRSAPNGSGDKDPQPPDELPPYETPDRSVLLRHTQETVASLKALIKNRDFAKAVNTAIVFRNGNSDLAQANGNEYRTLLLLQRTATKECATLGDLDVAVIDHDLMNAYLQATMPNFARDFFVDAEQGYERALSAARHRERTASGRSSAKRDIQQINENLGGLYAAWAEHTLDIKVLRKAAAAFEESERLLDYAEDPTSAKKQLKIGRANVERTRRRLP